MNPSSALRQPRNVDGKVILYADTITGSMERAMAETNRRREKQLEYNRANGITPESVKSRIADILDSVYEKDHVRADISQFVDDAGQMMGNNLKAHLEYLQKKMRDAAADLNFEEAARLRDEIKRLTEMELAISDDPLAREVERESPFSGREKGRHNKGRERHRTLDEGVSGKASLFAKPQLDEMGRAGDCAERAKAPSKPLFQKPSLDDMGPGTDVAKPAGAIPRSLFKKQTHQEAHGSDYGVPDDSRRSRSGRPAAAPDGAPPRSEPRSGDSVSEENRKSLFRKNSLDEMTVRRTEKPMQGPKPVKREQIGLGSYEEPAEERQRSRRSRKTGRPGH